MTNGLSPAQLWRVADELEIRSLAEQYASAVDALDSDAFMSVFDEAASLVVLPRPGADPSSAYRGHAELAVIIDKIKVYARTFHFVGNHTVRIDRPQASGQVYCLAHHLTVGRDGATDFVMLIRYEDTYALTDRWRITQRRVVTEWTEDRVTGVAPPVTDRT